MRHEFRTGSGRICCSVTNPSDLCHSCKARARVVAAPPNGYTLALAARGQSIRTTALAQAAKLGETDGYRVGTAIRLLEEGRDAPLRANLADDPTYEPFGNPTNGYALALAAKENQ